MMDNLFEQSNNLINQFDNNKTTPFIDWIETMKSVDSLDDSTSPFDSTKIIQMPESFWQSPGDNSQPLEIFDLHIGNGDIQGETTNGTLQRNEPLKNFDLADDTGVRVVDDERLNQLWNEHQWRTEANDSVEKGDTLPFPPRKPGDQLTGSAFFRDVLGVNPEGGKFQNGLTGVDRELAILEQIEAGNIPDFLRHAKKVIVHDNNGNTAELSVMPDYLGIGTNEDWVRVPITPILARSIKDHYGLELPTRKVANDIYNQADVRITAEGLVNKSSDYSYMQGNGFYFKHNQMIENHLSDTSDGALVAGQKKDIIVSRYAETHPDKLDFYGFFDANGRPIQKAGGGPHDNSYVDYNHGARFINESIVVNGKPMLYADVLRNPELSGLLSDEGTVNVNGIYRRPVYPQYQVLF